LADGVRSNERSDRDAASERRRAGGRDQGQTKWPPSATTNTLRVIWNRLTTSVIRLSGPRDRLSRGMAPTLLGATPRRQMFTALGAGVAVWLAAITGTWAHGDAGSLPWIAPPMASSAVLVFSLPASPLAQPWPVLGGNCLSALLGVALGHAFGHSALVCGLAVAAAGASMLATRSLHPPGAAAAVTGVLGGRSGWLFPFLPLGLNLVALLASGFIFHRLTGRAYPHALSHPPPIREAGGSSATREEDIDAVVAEIGEAVDMTRDDLRFIVSRLESRIAARSVAQQRL